MNKFCAVCMLILLSHLVTAVMASERPQLDGIWQGTFDINGNGPFDFTAIHVGANSSAVSNAAKTLCMGEVRIEADRYQAEYTMYALDGSPFDQATITGTLQSNQIESQFVTGNAGDTGKLVLTYNPIYEEDSSLEKIQGEWQFIDRDNLELNWTIKQGVIQGSDSDKCSYAGEVAIIDSNYNAYAVRVAITECGSVDGEYLGFGYVETNAQDFFRIDLAGEFYGFHFDLQQ